MTSAAEFGACQARAQSTGAWRSSQKSRWRVEARATSFESHISSIGRSVVGEAAMAARVHENDLEVRDSEAARGTASGDRISGFSLRETEEHACVVCFFRRRLDLHRSVR